MLINELKIGEKSGFVKDFDPDSFLNDLHKKHLSYEIQNKEENLEVIRILHQSMDIETRLND